MSLNITISDQSNSTFQRLRIAQRFIVSLKNVHKPNSHTEINIYLLHKFNLSAKFKYPTTTWEHTQQRTQEYAGPSRAPNFIIYPRLKIEFFKY